MEAPKPTGRSPLLRDENGVAVRQLNRGVRLTQEQIDKAHRIGGNLANGIRVALEAYEEV